MEALFGTVLRPFACHPNLYATSMSLSLFFGLPVYTLTLMALYRNRKIAPLDSLFFRLVLCLGIIDILQVSAMYIVIKFPGIGWFTGFYIFANRIDVSALTNEALKEGNRKHNETTSFQKWVQSPVNEIFPTLGRCALTFFAGMQYFGVTLTSLNRFTSIYFWNSSRHSRVKWQIVQTG